MNGFALGLGLKRRLRVTRKWAIDTRSRQTENNAVLKTVVVLLQKCYLKCLDCCTKGENRKSAQVLPPHGSLEFCFSVQFCLFDEQQSC